jgi:hypothetical protein
MKIDLPRSKYYQSDPGIALSLGTIAPNQELSDTAPEVLCTEASAISTFMTPSWGVWVFEGLQALSCGITWKTCVGVA